MYEVCTVFCYAQNLENKSYIKTRKHQMLPHFKCLVWYVDPIYSKIVPLVLHGLVARFVALTMSHTNTPK
jgi:hypothetical protein